MNGMNSRQKWMVVVMDALILTELFVAIWLSNQAGDAMTTMFLKIYVPSLLVTVVGCRRIIRALGDKEPEAETGDAPGLAAQAGGRS